MQSLTFEGLNFNGQIGPLVHEGNSTRGSLGGSYDDWYEGQ